MLNSLLPYFIFILTILVILTNHPLILRFFLIFARILYALILYIHSLTSWLPYILVMVFLSGIIVIIIYIASLSSNEPFNFFSKHSFFMFFSLNLILLLMNLIFNNNYNISNIKQLNSLTNFNYTHSRQLIYKTYNFINWKLTLLLILYLFVVLIVAVKITSLNTGPLRTQK